MDRRERGYLALVVLIALGLRLYYICQPMRYDEAFGFLFFFSQPLSFSLSHYIAPNNHLLYNLFAHPLYVLLGDSEWVMRIPSFLFGLLLIPAGYYLISSLFNKESGLLSAVLLATSSLLIEYSTNARGYTLYLLLAIVFFYSIELIFKKQKGGWVYFILSATLGLYTIPVMVYPIIVGLFWFLTRIIQDRFKKHKIKMLIISMIIVSLLSLGLYLPVILQSGLASIFANRFVSLGCSFGFIEDLPRYLSNLWSSWMRDFPGWDRLALVLALFVGTVGSKELRKKYISILIPSVLAIMSILFLSRKIPPQRVFMFLIPLYFGAVSSALVYIFKCDFKKVLFRIIVISITLFLSFAVIKEGAVIKSEETGTLSGAEDLVLFLKGRLKEGDNVLCFMPVDFILAYYFNHYSISWSYLGADLKTTERVFIVLKKGQDLSSLLEKNNLPSFLNNSKYITSFKDANLYSYLDFKSTLLQF
ncbi:MAG: glycosyltransferase family 39 protein [Candidatus Kaelpia imicola]|nr:glycosyltransferase family 39 protein [Candidatus Kaelpia imicola]